MNIPAIKQYLLDRAQEPSTWRGLVLIATGAGCYTLPAGMTVEHVVSIGLTITGLIGAATKDKQHGG